NASVIVPTLLGPPCRILLVRGGGIWFYALLDTHCAICIIRIGRADSLAGNRPKLFMRFDLHLQPLFSNLVETCSRSRGYSSLGFVGSCHPSPSILFIVIGSGEVASGLFDLLLIGFDILDGFAEHVSDGIIPT